MRYRPQGLSREAVRRIGFRHGCGRYGRLRPGVFWRGEARGGGDVDRAGPCPSLAPEADLDPNLASMPFRLGGWRRTTPRSLPAEMTVLGGQMRGCCSVMRVSSQILAQDVLRPIPHHLHRRLPLASRVFPSSFDQLPIHPPAVSPLFDTAPSLHLASAALPTIPLSVLFERALSEGRRTT